MKLRDLYVGMKIKSIRSGQVEQIKSINYDLGAFTTEQHLYWSFQYNKEWELYTPEFDGPQDAITHLKADDYQSLLTLAVELDDKYWFKEICHTMNLLKVGEQHV